jgi:serine/threonine-protein kinase
VCPDDGELLVRIGPPGEGARVGGRYVVGPLVTRDLWCTRHAATDQTTGQPVMLRVIESDISPSTATLMLRTAKLFVGRAHPNLLPVLDASEDPDYGPFSVHPPVATIPLERWRADEGAVSIAAGAQVIAGVARALAFGHALGAVHGMLDPERIFVIRSAEGRVDGLLTDFSLGTPPYGRDLYVDATGPAVGQLDFIPPEGLRGTTPSPPWDVYALGVVLFEVLTGRAPFVGSQRANIVSRMTADAPLLSSARADVPRRLDVLVAGMLDRAPEARPEAAGVAAALAAFTAEAHAGSAR